MIEVVTEESRIHQSHALNFWYANQNEMMELWKSNFRQELKKKEGKKKIHTYFQIILINIYHLPYKKNPFASFFILFLTNRVTLS